MRQRIKFALFLTPAPVSFHLSQFAENPEARGNSQTYIVEAKQELENLLREMALETRPSWSSLAEHLNKLDAMVLEGISTILFLRHTIKNDKEVRERLLKLKPHLNDLADRCFTETNLLPEVSQRRL